MKNRISSGLLLLLLFSTAKAQTVFQGEILYKATYKSAREEKPENPLTATVLFGKDRIRVSLQENDGERPVEEFLIFLDSGKVYSLDKGEKTFNRRWLGTPVQRSQQALESRTILGYRTQPVADPSGNVAGYTGVLMSMSDRLFYVSDSLYYPVPEKYQLNPELVMIRNNHIVLGGVIEMRNRYWGVERDDENNELVLLKDSILIEAIAVRPGTVDPQQLMVPADFENEIYKYSNQNADTTVAVPDVAMDTVMVPAPAVAAPVKKTAPQKPVPKKTGSTKSPANLRKQ